ncbi:MAG TPA: hypothetical protein VJZ71_21390 [Phycisphaerae bacterium]|nr:hypothetical protein [Phycisphaerae bacterium]
MQSVNRLVVALRRTGWLCALLAIALCAVATEAGPGGRGGGRQRGAPSKPSNSGGSEQPRDIPAGNTTFGRVIKYTLAADDKEENLLGVLSFDPQGKSAKKVDLRVIREPEPVIDVPDANNFRIELDQLAELITKGLYCDASWDLADPLESEKKNAKKNLARLSLTTIEVVGKIEKIEADQIIIKAKPKGNRTWPDLESKAMDAPIRPGNNPTATAKPKSVPVRKLTLKVLDSATRFVDSANKELDPGDFQPQQSVEAKIVYGKQGILVVLIDPNSKSGSESDDRQAGSGGGRGGPRLPPPGG